MRELPEILEPWRSLDESSAQWWEDEYAREISKCHPLYGVPVKAIAYQGLWCIYRLLRHESEYVVVELTLSGREECAPHVPAFKLYRDALHLSKDCIEPNNSEWHREVRQSVLQQGHFTVGLAPHNYDASSSLPAHEQVLRPLLRIADECWVYGVSTDSVIWRTSAEILEPHRSKHRIRPRAEPIVGHELLWNARGGMRGTILLLCNATALLQSNVFQHCSRPYVLGNMGVAHTPSAIRLAKKSVGRSGVVALLLPRNNGLQWMDINAGSELALLLFDHAYRQCSGCPRDEVIP